MNASPPYEPSRLRILHLVPSIGRRSGGCGTVAKNLASEQSRLGSNVSVWTLDDKDEALEIEREFKLESSIVTTFKRRGPSYLGFSPAMERATVTSLGASQHILHQHGIWMANSRATNAWRKAFGRPTVVAPHGSLEEYALRRSSFKKSLARLAYEAKNLKLASCLHATCADEANSIRRYGLVNPIAIIPNGIPEDWMRERGDPRRFRSRFSIPSESRLFLFLSRIHPIKGIPLLVESFSIVRQKLGDWRLVLAGPDEVNHRREVEKLIHNLGLEDQIRFVGPLYGNAKRDAFSAADVFVLPTHSENFAIVVAEALGAGVPVITTRGTPWEELETYKCGWWVDINSISLCDALLDARSRSKEELREMGHRGVHLISRKYTWPQIARQSILLYMWLRGNGSKPDYVFL